MVDATDAWDALPGVLGDIADESGIAAAPTEPVAIRLLDVPVQQELVQRLQALGYLDRDVAPTPGELLRAWSSFVGPRKRRPGLVTPQRWERLLRWTVLEREIEVADAETDLGRRALRYRMFLLGFDTYRDLPRYSDLIRQLRRIEFPGTPKVHDDGADAWAADQLGDLARFSRRVTRSLERRTPQEREALEKKGSTFIARLLYVEALASAFVATAHMDPDQARSLDQGLQTLGLESVAGGLESVADPWPEPVHGEADPRPLDPEARQQLARLLGRGLESAGEPSLDSAALSRFIDEQTVLEEAPEGEAPDVVEEFLDALPEQRGPKLLRNAFRSIGLKSIWEGIQRATNWVRRQWKRLKAFFTRLFQSTSDTPRERDRATWQVVIQALSRRVSQVLTGVVDGVRSLWVWLGRRGRVVTDDDGVVGAFEIDGDFDLVVVQGAGTAERTIAALERQRSAFTATTRTIGDVLRVVVEVAAVASTGGVALAWRLIPKLARLAANRAAWT